MTGLPNLETAAKRLGGELRAGEILCPGPNHTDADRSLAVKLDDAAPDGFLVHSFAGDDEIKCRDHVRSKLGLPAFEPHAKKNGGGAAWKLISEHIYRDEAGKSYLRVRKCLDGEGKKQYPQSRWDGAQWVNGKPKGAKIPYRLPELLAAPLTATIYVVEGEKCAEALAKLGFVVTTNSEGAGKWSDDLNEHFKGRHVVILGDNDRPGRKHVQRVAKSLHGTATTVRVLELAQHWPGEPMPEGDDVADWIGQHDRAGSKLAALAKDAPLWESGAEPAGSDARDGDDDALLAELTALSDLAYARRRKESARILDIGVTDLDRIVRRARGKREHEDKAPPRSLLYEHWSVEPCEEPVEGEILLRALVETLRRYVVMDKDQAIVAGLWVILTWIHEHVAVHSPILLATSPLPNSGKTTLLKLVTFLVRNGLSSVSITGAALFRSIEKWKPTIAIDEADTAFMNNDDLKDVVNSGWTRGDCIIRCDPDTHDPRAYPTFCPKAIGMIGRKLPPATISRCITLAMRRKRPDEHAEDFDHVDDGNLARLRSQLLRWANDNAAALVTATPEIPSGLHNRTRMNWRILLAIAERCRSKKAAWGAVKAVEEVSATVDPELAAQLLSDIRDAFVGLKTDKLTTKALLAELTGNEEGPWLSYGKARKPLNDRQLGRLLKDFRRGKGIKSKNVRTEGITGVAKGYERADFEDDFAAYLAYPATDFSSEPLKTAFPAETPLQVNDFNGLWQKSPATGDRSVAAENEPNPLETSNCSGVADNDPDLAAVEEVEEKASADGDDSGPIRSSDQSSQPVGLCAQCNGLAADAPLVKGEGYPPSGVHLHEQCREFWLKRHRVGRDRFRKVDDCAPGTHCALCHSPGEVALWRNTHIVGCPAEQLHEACAPKWWCDV